MAKIKQLSLFVKEEDVNIIDAAATKTKRSRSNFIIMSSVEKAEKILLDEE